MDAEPFASSLGHFEILQLAVAVVAVIVALGIAWRAFRAPTEKKTSDEWMPPQFYFHGPIQVVTGLLRDIYQELHEKRESDERRFIEEREARERWARDQRDSHDKLMDLVRRLERRD